MTPFGPEEEIDESEVINVTGEDGVVRRYRKRRMGLWNFRNHAFSNDFIQGAVKKITLVRATLGLLGVVAGMMWTVLWGSYKYVIAPQQERVIAAAVAQQLVPIVKEQEEQERIFQQHLVDVANQRALFPTRIELKEDLTEIKAMIQRLEDRKK